MSLLSALIIIIEEEQTMRSVISGCLRFVGFDVQETADAAGADALIGQLTPSLLMLSDNLNGDGTQLLRRIRARETDIRLPVLMLTDDRRRPEQPSSREFVDGFLPRSAAPHVLVECVEGLLRDTQPASTIAALHFAGLELLLATRTARFGDLHVVLGPTEFRLLAFLIGNPERVFSRAQLLERLWAYTVRVEERTIDVHIRRLREALIKVGCEQFVQTVTRVGYRLSAQAG
jgi:two-component system phosphate regulon response regulator PhoB